MEAAKAKEARRQQDAEAKTALEVERAQLNGNEDFQAFVLHTIGMADRPKQKKKARTIFSLLRSIQESSVTWASPWSAGTSEKTKADGKKDKKRNKKLHRKRAKKRKPGRNGKHSSPSKSKGDKPPARKKKGKKVCEVLVIDGDALAARALHQGHPGDVWHARRGVVTEGLAARAHMLVQGWCGAARAQESRKREEERGRGGCACQGATSPGKTLI